MRDEFGTHTASSFGDGWRRDTEEKQKEHFLPTLGSMTLQFNAVSGGPVGLDEREKRVFNLQLRAFNLTALLWLQQGERGLSVVRLELDDRQGSVDIFLGVFCVKQDGPAQACALRLDSVTVVFADGFWRLEDSLARKMGLMGTNGLRPQRDSSLHWALDGDEHTAFRSAAPLQQDQALVIDLEMAYALTRFTLKEEEGFECGACVLEASVDRLNWALIHTFTEGVGENVTFAERQRAGRQQGADGADGSEAQERDVLPTVARFIRVRATETEDRVRMHWYWGVFELQVFGEELRDSVATEAPIWYEEAAGRGPAKEAEGAKEGGAGEHPATHATDSDMTTSFVTRTPPSGSNGGQALVLDLQEAYELALVTVWQNETRACTVCVLQRSLDGEAWEDLQFMVHTDGMVMVGFAPGDRENPPVVARFIRALVAAPMETPWEVIEMQAFGVPAKTEPKPSVLDVVEKEDEEEEREEGEAEGEEQAEASTE